MKNKKKRTQKAQNPYAYSAILFAYAALILVIIGAGIINYHSIDVEERECVVVSNPDGYKFLVGNREYCFIDDQLCGSYITKNSYGESEKHIFYGVDPDTRQIIDWDEMNYDSMLALDNEIWLTEQQINEQRSLLTCYNKKEKLWEKEIAASAMVRPVLHSQNVAIASGDAIKNAIQISIHAPDGHELDHLSLEPMNDNDERLIGYIMISIDKCIVLTQRDGERITGRLFDHEKCIGEVASDQLKYETISKQEQCRSCYDHKNEVLYIPNHKDIIAMDFGAHKCRIIHCNWFSGKKNLVHTGEAREYAAMIIEHKGIACFASDKNTIEVYSYDLLTQKRHARKYRISLAMYGVEDLCPTNGGLFVLVSVDNRNKNNLTGLGQGEIYGLIDINSFLNDE